MKFGKLDLENSDVKVEFCTIVMLKMTVRYQGVIAGALFCKKVRLLCAKYGL